MFGMNGHVVAELQHTRAVKSKIPLPTADLNNARLMQNVGDSPSKIPIPVQHALRTPKKSSCSMGKHDLTPQSKPQPPPKKKASFVTPSKERLPGGSIIKCWNMWILYTILNIAKMTDVKHVKIHYLNQ